MPEILRTVVVEGTTLVAPAPVFDPATAAAVAAERDAAAADGYARGLADGRAAATDALGGLLATVTTALDRLHAEVATQRAAALAVDLDLVARVVDAVLATAPPPALDVLRERLAAAVAVLDDDRITVRVHPGDLAALDATLADRRIELVADPALAAGEAAAAGTWGRADLTRDGLRAAALEVLTVGEVTS